jgi:glycerate kinase
MKSRAPSSGFAGLRVLIAPDKFKGTLSAEQAAHAIAAGWKRSRPRDILELFPISDGGDGFGELYGRLDRAKPRITTTLNAAHQRCESRWWWQPKTRTAIIDSSAAIGLAMLPPKKFHPFHLDTFGLGKLLAAAANTGARNCILGIGGSATNDGGFGLARSLGWKFLNARGTEIVRWIDLKSLRSLRPPETPMAFEQITVAVDVKNPLLGPRGASRIYGPQKGLEPTDFKPAEAALRQLASVVKQQIGRDLARQPGAGAAGGLGFGLAAFLDARLVPGFELFAKLSELRTQLQRSDLVITGEGALDGSTMMGKAVGELGRLSKSLKLPCHVLAGHIQETKEMSKTFSSTTSLTELTSKARAINRPAFWLSRASSELAANL